jgi:hypothetical protein
VDPGQSPPARPARLRIVLGVAAAVVLLAVLGFTVGWVLHGSGTTRTGASTAPSSAAPTSAAPIPTLAPLALPDVTGRDFVVARQQLRDLSLGVQLVFADSGDSRAVRQTEPAPGSPVDRGITIKVYVSGTAPLLVPPDVVGRPCNDAGKAVADAGLYPQYLTGRHGIVTAQHPPAGAAGVHWNDQTRLTCTDAASVPPSP